MSSDVSIPVATPASSPPPIRLPAAMLALLLVRGGLLGLACALIWHAAMSGAGAISWGQISLQVSLFAVLALGSAYFQIRRLPLFADVTDAGLRLSGPGEAWTLSYDEVLALQPVPTSTIMHMLLLPGQALPFLTSPVAFDGWWSLRTSNGEFLFRCDAGGTPRPQTRRLFSPETAAVLPGKRQPFRFGASWPLDVGLCATGFAIPAFMPLLLIYAVWRIRFLWRRYRARAAWAVLRPAAVQSERSIPAGRPGPGASRVIRPFRDSLMRWLWSLSVLPFLVLRWSIPFLAALRSWIQGGFGLLLRTHLQLLRVLLFSMQGTLKHWRVIVLLVVGWLSALLLAELLLPLFADPLLKLPRQPWQVRIALLRHGDEGGARLATAMLEKARSSKDDAAVSAVLEGGARDGEFRLTGWQAESWHKGRCRDAVPEQSGIRMVLAETIVAAELLRELACTGPYLQRELLIDAFRRSGGTIDVMSAVASGYPQLLDLSDRKSGVDAVRDWQGRTPLLLALDLLAGDRSDPVWDSRRLGWLKIAILLEEQGADVGATDLGGRSATYLALAAGLSGVLFAPYRHPGAAKAVTALGATLVHAAAASGSPAAVDEALGLGAEIHARTLDGRSALHFARGAVMVRTLFRLGLDPDVPDSRGRTPLHAAVIAGDIEAARVLAAIMLRPLAADNFGRSPVDYLPVAGEAAARWQALRGVINERTART